jgi:hypothetical protein
MKKSLTKMFFVIFIAPALLSAQDKNTIKADKDFDNHSYAKAIDSYESLVDKGLKK